MNINVYKVEPYSEINEKLLLFVENSSWTDTKEHTAKMIRGHCFEDWESMFVAMDPQHHLQCSICAWRGTIITTTLLYEDTTLLYEEKK